MRDVSSVEFLQYPDTPSGLLPCWYKIRLRAPGWIYNIQLCVNAISCQYVSHAGISFILVSSERRETWLIARRVLHIFNDPMGNSQILLDRFVCTLPPLASHYLYWYFFTETGMATIVMWLKPSKSHGCYSFSISERDGMASQPNRKDTKLFYYVDTKLS